MRLFDGDPYTGYQRMRRAAPSFWNEFAEPQAIWDTSGIEHDKIRAEITRSVNSVLVPWAGDDGLDVYERFLQIEYTGGIKPEIDFRRAMVAAAFIGARHIGRPEILEILERFSPGAPAEVHLDRGNVLITVGAELADEPAFLRMMAKKLPAHLGMYTTMEVTRDVRYKLTLGVGGTIKAVFPEEMRSSERTVRQNVPVGAGTVCVTRLTGRLIPREEGE